MRQPMEERKVTISRAKVAVDFPTSFMLMASMNPCPCGFYNHPERECTCPPGAVQKYLNKISGPLLDRIDLHVEVTPVAFNELSSTKPQEFTKLWTIYISERQIFKIFLSAINQGSCPSNTFSLFTWSVPWLYSCSPARICVSRKWRPCWKRNLDESFAPEIKSILVFTSDEVELEPNDSPIPAMKLKQLKEFMRQGVKNRALTSDQIAKITGLFAQE